jgi:hypothetical protein
MKFSLETIFRNADTGHSDEQTVVVESDDASLCELAKVCAHQPTQENFRNLFKKMYDNPHLDGTEAGVLYGELWTIFSRWGFEKLGWGDVTVDVVGLSIDGERLPLDWDNFEVCEWSLQLSRDGFMVLF